MPPASRVIALLLSAGVLALAGCGDDEDETAGDSTAPAQTATTGTGTGTDAAPAQRAPLREGGVFQVNDLADCLLDAGVGAAVSLDGASIELHDAMSQVIVEQGNGEILVYGSAQRAAEEEDGYRRSFGRLSEVTRVRNVLFQADPDIDDAAKAKAEVCLGV